MGKRQRTKGELLQSLQVRTLAKEQLKMMFNSPAEVLMDGSIVMLNVARATDKPWDMPAEYHDFCKSLDGKEVYVQKHELLPNQYYLNGNKTWCFHIADLEVVADAE